jgi:hypothetical protein
MTSNTLFVEFYGLPCSGKSFVAKKLYRYMKFDKKKQHLTIKLISLDKFCYIYRQFYKLYYCFFAFKDFNFIFFIVSHFIKNFFKNPVRQIKSHFNFIFIYGLCMFKHREEIVIIDQFFFQALWSLYSHKNTTLSLSFIRKASNFFSSRKISHISVNVKVSKCVLHQRTILRGNSKSDVILTSKINDLINQGSKINNKIIRFCANTYILNLNNSKFLTRKKLSYLSRKIIMIKNE